MHTTTLSRGDYNHVQLRISIQLTGTIHNTQYIENHDTVTAVIYISVHFEVHLLQMSLTEATVSFMSGLLRVPTNLRVLHTAGGRRQPSKYILIDTTSSQTRPTIGKCPTQPFGSCTPSDTSISHMSHEEDYTTNIDEQLLTAVKNQVNGHGLDDTSRIDTSRLDENRVKLEHSKGSDVSQEQHAAEAAQAAQALYHHQQHLHDVGELEYNIQIPEPIIDLRLKIYPVLENTITNEGNLITRPFPEQNFHTREELNEFIADFARVNGFGIVIAHSNRKAIYYTCELGGRYRHKKGKTIQQQQQEEEEEAAQRELNEAGTGYVLDSHARTKKLRCPFSMTASFRKSNSIWSLRTTCNEHNHPQLDPLSNHPMLRKRSDELNLLILDLYKVGTKPSHIEAKIKHQFPDVLIKREDIYNEIRGYKRKLKKLNKYMGAGVTPLGVKRRRNAALYHEVMDGDDDDDHDEVMLYELERQRHEELQRQIQAAEDAHNSHHHHHHEDISHSLSHHLHHLDEQQLQHYQQQLQEHGLHDSDHNDSTAAAAIAAVANATHGNSNSDLTIDNIDSRLVGD